MEKNHFQLQSEVNIKSETGVEGTCEVDGGQWRSMEVDGKPLFTTFGEIGRFWPKFHFFGQFSLFLPFWPFWALFAPNIQIWCQMCLNMPFLATLGPFGPKGNHMDPLGPNGPHLKP